MENAIKVILDSTDISISAAARDHGVPITTLKDRLSGRVRKEEDIRKRAKPSPVPYLSCSEEEKLAAYLLDANKVGCGKTRQQVKIIAEEVGTEGCFPWFSD